MSYCFVILLACILDYRQIKQNRKMHFLSRFLCIFWAAKEYHRQAMISSFSEESQLARQHIMPNTETSPRPTSPPASLQCMCSTGYDIWSRNLDPDKEQVTM